MARKKIVFISYSSKDKDVADRVRGSIPDAFEVWIDHEQVRAGDSISKTLQDGLSGADYFVLLISESSISSQWVQREIATAFELASKKNLSVVPVLLKGSDIPFEFKGLLYIDFRPSIATGIQRLHDFFIAQAAPVDEIEPRHKILRSQDDRIHRRLACNESLRHLSLGDLRYLVSERLGLEEIEVIWFDLFNHRMSDEGSDSKFGDVLRRIDRPIQTNGYPCRTSRHALS